jgi:hypothetical protein
MKTPAYKYTWKHGICISSNAEVEFRVPLQQGMIFVDLLNGNAYLVHSLYKAKENDRMITTMSEDVVHTFPSRSLTDEELATLRERYKFQPDELTRPGLELAILDLVTAPS